MTEILVLYYAVTDATKLDRVPDQDLATAENFGFNMAVRLQYFQSQRMKYHHPHTPRFVRRVTGKVSSVIGRLIYLLDGSSQTVYRIRTERFPVAADSVDDDNLPF